MIQQDKNYLRSNFVKEMFRFQIDQNKKGVGNDILILDLRVNLNGIRFEQL